LSNPHSKKKEKIIQAADNKAASWKDLALKIHANPEIGLKEEKASSWLTEELAKAGFRVERGLADLPTSFIASRGETAAKPTIAFMAEYDALPGLGHACGHNLICTAAGLAAVSLIEAIDAREARILVIGSPAEENYAGKVQLIERGCLKNVDVALMAHGHRTNLAYRPTMGRQMLIF
jgi:amidohydrolase